MSQTDHKDNHHHDHKDNHSHDDQHHHHEELKLGSKGHFVLGLQWRLASFGYYKGKKDSEYGPETEKAVKAFQKDEGIKEDGIFGSVSNHHFHKKTKHFQFVLSHLGYDIGKIDGELGPLTVDGIRQFQSKNKLEANGVFCENCCKALQEQVKEIQTYLWRFGCYHGKVDGDFGYWTMSAVKEFQKHLHLKEDGIAGPITRGKFHEAAYILQWTLKGLGYDVDQPTGAFNDKTDAALKKFQKDNSLKDDRVFGVVTYHALHNVVKKLQWTLTSIGIEVGKADGMFGPLTANGVKEFQKRHQLKVVDGFVGEETRNSITETVKELQRRLKFVGGDVGPADGVLGPRTHEAVLKFQKHHGLKEDGIVGMITWTKMYKTMQHLQSTLRHLGYDIEVPQGHQHMDEKTNEKILAVVKDFQKNKNLVVDGIAGPVTQYELEKETKRVQRHLVGVGFDIGKAGVDGVFGPFTEGAVKNFQKEVGLDQTGVFCKKTLEKMQEWVKKIQTELTNKKYECGPVDGVYGYLTQSAVKSFQKDNALVEDGVAGRITRTKLFPK